jgi:pSer/pThr/pTyr-binding forkhead associated (FHA) protein
LPVANGPISSAAAPRARSRLVIIAKDGGEGPSHPLAEQIDIGREEGDIRFADDGYLSPRHARLAHRGGRLYLRDLESVNGLFLRITSEVALKSQDVFLVGQQVIRFEVVNEGEEGLGPAKQHGTLLFGTPAGPRYARLCQRTVEGVTRDVYYVRKAEVVLGRESGDIVFTEDPFLSRRHAAVRMLPQPQDWTASGPGRPGPGSPSAGRFVLCDLGSSNGTFVRIQGEVELKDGDQFRIGQQLLRVDLGQDA